MWPSGVMTAAAVSSQEVSRPRITVRAGAEGSRRVVDLSRLRVPPHDQSVLAVVGVIAATHTTRLEPGLLVQLDRDLVRHAHLQRVATAPVAGRPLEEAFGQPRRDPPGPGLGPG